jgi:hypothetical protein
VIPYFICVWCVDAPAELMGHCLGRQKVSHSDINLAKEYAAGKMSAGMKMAMESVVFPQEWIKVSTLAGLNIAWLSLQHLK